MLKPKQSILFVFCLFIFSCKGKSDNSLKISETTTQLQADYKAVTKMKDELNQLNLTEAATKYGAPQEKEIIKIIGNEIPYYLEELIKNHYPNKEYLKSDIEIIEASWKVREQSWVQVWYKLEYKIWVPIDTMITL